MKNKTNKNIKSIKKKHIRELPVISLKLNLHRKFFLNINNHAKISGHA